MKTDLPIFKVFQHSEEYFEMLSDNTFSRKYVFKQMLFILLFTFIYGIVMGSYNGFLQSMVTGIKIPCLIFLSLLICFPALFVIQYMIGSTLTIYQMTNIILSGFFEKSELSLIINLVAVFSFLNSCRECRIFQITGIFFFFFNNMLPTILL